VRVRGGALVQVALNQQPQSVGLASTLGTGILHGCSGSGHLLGVMPALAMPSWSIATTYLVMFGAGTMLAMSIFTAVRRRARAQPRARRRVRVQAFASRCSRERATRLRGWRAF
jgi:hypothetical protein